MSAWTQRSSFVIITTYVIQSAWARSFEIVHAHSQTKAEPLRVLVATFNAGNLVTPHKDGNETEIAKFDSFTDLLTAGHDKDGEVADIVVLGFQELSDGKIKDASSGTPGAMALRLKDRLWSSLGQTRRKEVADGIALTYDAQSQALDKAKKQYQEAALPYVEDLQKHCVAVKEQADQDIADFYKDYSEVLVNAQDAGKKVVDNIADKLEPLTSAADDFQIKALAHTSLQAESISPLVDNHHASDFLTTYLATSNLKYPSLKYTEAGMNEWSTFAKGVEEVHENLQKVGKLSHEQLVQSIQDFHNVIKQSDADGNQLNLTTDIKNVQQDLVNLKAHVDRIKSEKTDHALTQIANINKVLGDWKGNTQRELQSLELPSKYDMDAGFVDTQLEVVKFKGTGRGWTGAVMNLAKTVELTTRGDTMLYVYVNPWSRFKVTPVPYQSDRCATRSGYSGCTIDNNNIKEMGKGVNLAVLKVEDTTNPSAAFKLCAMNTHLSMKGEASQRMQNLVTAMKEAVDTDKANCSRVVFAGDFNSRLHCDADEAAPHNGNDRPNTHMHTEDDNTTATASFTNALYPFCKKNVTKATSCALNDGPTSWDEMTQLLGHESLKCYEEESIWKREGWIPGKKTQYTLAEPKTNELHKEFKGALKEAGPVGFAPTYKYKDPTDPKAEAPPTQTHCFEGESVCLVNKDNAVRHHPAWTDRVLVFPDGHFATKEYERRVPTEPMSDHIAVVARIEFPV